MSSDKGFGLSKIGQIAIRAKDFDRAVGFYRDTLGMKHLFTTPPKLAFFDCDGVRIMLDVPEQPEFDHPSSIIYFKVEDIEAAHRALEERGVTIVAKPHVVFRTDKYDLWMMFFRDSEENVLSLMSEKAK